MPITRDQFDKGMGGIATKVLEFLTVTPNQAFSVSEIADGLGWKGGPDFRGLVLHAISEVYGLQKALGVCLTNQSFPFYSNSDLPPKDQHSELKKEFRVQFSESLAD